MTKLPKRLEEMIEKKAEESFKREYAKFTKEERRPFSYAESYTHGATDLTLAVLSEAEKLVEALDLIEKTPPITDTEKLMQKCAFEALSDWKKFLGEE